MCINKQSSPIEVVYIICTVDSHLSLSLREGFTKIHNEHDKYNILLVGYLTDNMPLIDLGNSCHWPLRVINVVTQINVEYMVRQTPNSCSIVYVIQLYFYTCKTYIG